MTERRSTLLGALLLATMAREAYAQDVATSEALFQQGVAAMEKGDFARACPAIEESLRLDSRAGTLFTLAECYAKGGRAASAVTRYDEYLGLFAKMSPDQQARQQGREKIAEAQRAKLKPQIATLAVALAPGAPEGTTVRRDETELRGPSLGAALPVDAGEHVVIARTPDGQEVKEVVKLGPGESKALTLRVLGPATGAQGDKTAPPASGDYWTGQRIAGISLASAGAAGLIVGAVGGGLALSNKSAAEESCNIERETCATSEGLDHIDTAQTMGLMSTIGLAVGGGLLATGVVVFFTAPSSDVEVSVRYVPGGQMQLTTRF